MMNSSTLKIALAALLASSTSAIQLTQDECETIMHTDEEPVYGGSTEPLSTLDTIQLCDTHIFENFPGHKFTVEMSGCTDTVFDIVSDEKGTAITTVSAGPDPACTFTATSKKHTDVSWVLMTASVA